MNKLICISYSSNTRTKDLITNLITIITPTTWKSGKYNKMIKDIFEKRFSNSKAYTFNYARSGMYVLFKSLNQDNSGGEIIMQGFTCMAAVNPVIWSGLKPIYADINEDTLNIDIDRLEKLITNKTKAIMFQHTFGNSAGINETKALCEKHGLLLIEDCANTIFGKNNNQLIGSIADAAIFSFGRDKAVSGVNGGLILINKNSLVSNFEKIYWELNYPSNVWILQQLVYQPLWSLIKKLYNYKLGKAIHLLANKLHLLTTATSNREKMGKRTSVIPALLPNALAKLTYVQLADIEKINNHRLEINNIYMKQLNKFKSVKHVEGNVLLRYPIVVENREQLLKEFKRENILLGDWYNKPITPIKIPFSSVYYTKGQCEISEKVSDKIVNLPNHINISEKDAYKVCELLNKYNAK